MIRPTSGNRILKLFPHDENGRRPNVETFRKWMHEKGWIERADALDSEASLVLEKDAVEKRVATLRRIAEYGEKLAAKGMDFIENNPEAFVDNVSAAVRAVVSGSEMIFKYAGAADKLAAINAMSDKQLEREILRQLGQDSSENENNENDETIETTAEDITEETPDAEDNDA